MSSHIKIIKVNCLSVRLLNCAQNPFYSPVQKKRGLIFCLQLETFFPLKYYYEIPDK